MGILRCAGGKKHGVRKVYQCGKVHNGLAPEHGKTGFTSFSRDQSKEKRDSSKTILFQLNFPKFECFLPL